MNEGLFLVDANAANGVSLKRRWFMLETAQPTGLKNTMSLKNALKEAVENSKAPGAVLYVGDSGKTYVHDATGYRQLTPHKKRAKKNTLYDLASLTKVVATSTSLMQLHEQGLFALDDPVTKFIPIPALEGITLQHLLTHTSGLVAVEHYYRTMYALEEMLQHYALEGLERQPDVEHLYSDVGYMMLGKVIEVISRMPLDDYCQQHIFDPLGMSQTVFNPSDAQKKNCAATEYDRLWRKKLILGEVHDENSYALDGMSGHAGLFSTAEDMALFCRGLLGGQLLKAETLAAMTTFGTKPLYPWQGIGWQMDPWSSKSIGFLPTRRAFGHTGFTGTSLWLDPDKGLFAVLLSNTCHPDRALRDNVHLRRIVHTAIAKEFYTTTNAHSGLDRLIRENFVTINEKNIAVLTNHAAIDQSERHILEVLPDAPELQLKRLYSPEHGIRGQAEAGEKVAGQDSAIPVTSLYGKQKEPTAEELKGIDLFVIDLQDIGARYYTYMATMRACMAACGKAKVPVLVLDRPNPLGGLVLEGPIADRTDTLVSCTAIPIRHGMTMGELATWFATTDLQSLNVDLTVNYLDSWVPYRFFGECSLPWRAPSPNMPTADTALLYIGTCLIEGTNLNEGRGTDTPFAVLGAPWLNPGAVLGELNDADRAGLTLRATEYTPRSIPGKSTNPKFKDLVCQGIRLEIIDRDKVRAFRTTVALIQAIRKHHPDHFELNAFFDTLAGGYDLRARIIKRQATAKIIKDYAQQHAAFNERRPRLYNEEGIPIELE